MDDGAPGAAALAAGGLTWLLGSAAEAGTGLAWPGSAAEAEIDPTLYSGGAGIVLTLLEEHRRFRDDRYADAAVRGSRPAVGHLPAASYSAASCPAARPARA